MLGIGLLTQFNALFSYNTKLVWLALTPLVMGSGRVVLRLVLKSLRKRGLNTRRFAICGVNKIGLQLARNIQASPELGLSLAGYFDDRPAHRNKDIDEETCPRAGTLNKLVAQAKAGEVDIVFVTFPMRAEKRIQDYLDKLADTTASVYIVPDFVIEYP